MPPANDNFANASVLSGAAGSFTGSNAGATVETLEPGRLTYNPGPTLPSGNAGVAAAHTVWYAWTCPATGDYFFTTRDNSGAVRTTFPSVIQVFTGTAVNSLTEAHYWINASVGDGWGTDNGASVALECISGTTYYIRVDGRGGATGGFYFQWGAWDALWLGPCTACALNLRSFKCVGTTSLPNATADSFYSFGTQPASGAGDYQVQYCSGAYRTGSLGAYAYSNYGGILCFSGDYEIITAGTTPIIGWDSSGDSTYTAGQIVAWGGLWTAAVNIPSYDPRVTGPSAYWQGGGSTLAAYSPYDNYLIGEGVLALGIGGSFFYIAVQNVPAQVPGGAGTITGLWNGSGNQIPLNTTTDYSIGTVSRDAACYQTSRFLHTGGQIGIVFPLLLAGATPANTGAMPTFLLLYNPFTINLLSTAGGFVINTGSGTGPWSFQFQITNLSSLDWDNVSVTLLNTGGISGATPSAGGDAGTISGSSWIVDLPAAIQTSVGNFIFNADPTAGLVTATLQISRNGTVIGTLVYPLYPIYGQPTVTTPNVLEHNCGSFKYWASKITIPALWPPNPMPFWGAPFAYGGFMPTNNLVIAFSTVAGSPNLFNGTCTVIASIISNSADSGNFSTLNLEPAFQAVTGSVQSVPCQVTFAWQVSASIILNLPTASLTINVAAA